VAGTQVPAGWDELMDRVLESEAAIVCAVLSDLDFVVVRRDSPSVRLRTFGAMRQQILVRDGERDAALAAWRAWCDAPFVFPDDLGEG
jgi:hypothetical protein